MDDLVKDSTILTLRIDGFYDCERDSGRISEEIFNFIHPNQSPKAALCFDEN